MNEPGLAHLRRRLDGVDRALIHLLGERHHVILALAALKEQDDLDVVQPERDAETAELRAAWAKAEGLDADFVADLFARIVGEAKRVQFERRG